MFTEDLDAYLADFGIASTLQGGIVGNVMAIYDEAYLEQFSIAGIKPVCVVKASAVAVGDIGKTLTRTDTSGVRTIKGREPIDDGAFVALSLKD